MEKINKALNPSFPFSYGFVDQDINNLYKGEEQMGSLFNIFAIIAIFISCMGLYGLSAFMAEQRTKEIGVRKVLGASVFNVVYLLSTGFTKLILIAIVIAMHTLYCFKGGKCFKMDEMHSYLHSFVFTKPFNVIEHVILLNMKTILTDFN